MKRTTFNTKLHIKAQKGTPVNVMRDLMIRKTKEEKEMKVRNQYLYEIDQYEAFNQVMSAVM